MFLKSHDITVSRGGSNKLTFPNLNIDTGDKVLLLGESGSGKTTLMSVLAGFLKPTGGEILINGQDIHSLKSKQIDQIRGQNFGFVFQTLHLLPSLTLEQNILLAADMIDMQAEEGRLEALLDMLGLVNKKHRKPDALSQGEQQRAAIARAVLLKPKIIIADEPTSALDDKNAEIVMRLLEEQAKDTGAALLVATHDSRIKKNFDTILNLKNEMEDV